MTRYFCFSAGIALSLTLALPAQENPPSDQQGERNERAISALRDLIDTRYAFRDRVVEDWDEVFADARDGLLTAESDEMWARRAAAALAVARDGHLGFEHPGGRTLSFTERPPFNYDLRALDMVVEDLHKPNDVVWHGVVRDGDRRLGYLLVRKLSPELRKELRVVNEFLDDLSGDVDGLVLDLRPNSGGSEILAMQIAAHFIKGTKAYGALFNRNAKTGAWDRRRVRKIAGRRESRRFHGPVAVLVGSGCASAGEGLALMMRQAEDVRLVGARTRGASGHPKSHRLPNGVNLWLPSSRTVDADGKLIEGAGITPDVVVATRAEDFKKGDPVLAKAIETLRQ